MDGAYAWRGVDAAVVRSALRLSKPQALRPPLWWDSVLRPSLVCGPQLQRADDADAAPVVEQRFGAVDAAAEAAFADAAVGHAVGEQIVGIYPGVAGSHLFGDA